MPTETLKFEFNRDKAVEAILYIARRIPDPTFHSISKLLYFADKTSLERYGRFICGDTYYAMQYGPVPSNTYNLMKHESQNGEHGFRVENGKDILPLREANLDELSESDIESLDVTIDHYGPMTGWQRTEESHDDAWKEAWENRGEAQRNIMTVDSIARLLDDADELLEYLQNRHDN